MKKEIIDQTFEQTRCNERFSYDFEYDLSKAYTAIFNEDSTVFHRETQDLVMNYNEMVNLVKDFEKVYEKFNGSKGFILYVNKKTKTLLLVHTLIFTKEPDKNKPISTKKLLNFLDLYDYNKIEKPTHADKFVIVSNSAIFSSQLYQEILSKSQSLSKLKNSLIPKENNIFIINRENSRFYLDHYDIESSEDFKDIIESNYNDNFKLAYEDLIKFLSNDLPGLVLFTGKPGTGKSSLIQHLINKADELDKRFVILPASFIDILADSDFTSFAVKSLSDAILCIEDAEDVLADRNLGQNAAVKNILNITDGILGKVMKTKIICTVNNETSLDKALLRKGRLKLKYHFEPLSAEKATKLSAKLGINKVYTEPATLADIYNEEQKIDYEKPIKRIGFGSN